MSISTSLIGSYLCRSCSSDVLRSDNQRESWQKLEDRVRDFDDTIDQFMEAFVPSSAPPLPAAALEGAFATFNPQPGQEVRSYGGLLAGLRKAVSRFPASKKLTFFPNHREKLAFPFKAFEHNHHDTYPDIAISFPGQPLPKADWKHIAAFVEVKASTTDDPFRKDGNKHCRTLFQMAVDARGLVVAHGLLVAFVIGVYGHTARIVRYDHSGVVASPSFSLRGSPEVLRKFFWRFVHPVVGDTVVGYDPTTRSLAPPELTWVQKCLRLAGKDPLQDPDRCRRVEVPDTSTDGTTSQAYFLVRLIDINARLLSRSTTVWLAIKDPRELIDRRLPPLPNVDGPDAANLQQVIVKDAWRRLVRRNEKMFYDRLACTIPEDEYYGLPRVVCGSDLGAMEANFWKASGGELRPPCNVRQPPILPINNSHAPDAHPPKTPSRAPSSLYRSNNAQVPSSSPVIPSTPVQQHTTSILSSPLTPLTSEASSTQAQNASDMSVDFGSDLTGLSSTSRHVSEAPQPVQFPLPYPQQQTFMWRVLEGDALRHRERSHMRFVVDTVGRPLTRFRSTREMVLAMRDAITGHKLAWERAKLLHRDVSAGNILIVEDHVENGFRGFLHDFDYSYMEDLDEAIRERSQSQADDGVASSESNAALDPTRTTDTSDVDDDLKERTGTYFFIAINILKKKDAIHLPQHDLESFFWVLVWVVLRHADHDDAEGDSACGNLFVYGNDRQSYQTKLGFIADEDVYVGVKGNVPLTQLLRKFKDLMRFHYKMEFPAIPLSHDRVLAVFNEALDMNGWPANDEALPVVLKSKKTTNVHRGQTDSKSYSKKRKENVGQFSNAGSSKRPRKSKAPAAFKLSGGTANLRRSQRGLKGS